MVTVEILCGWREIPTRPILAANLSPRFAAGHCRTMTGFVLQN
jgi:hypothetical protein